VSTENAASTRRSSSRSIPSRRTSPLVRMIVSTPVMQIGFPTASDVASSARVRPLRRRLLPDPASRLGYARQNGDREGTLSGAASTRGKSAAATGSTPLSGHAQESVNAFRQAGPFCGRGGTLSKRRQQTPDPIAPAETAARPASAEPPRASSPARTAGTLGEP
jgi:hypothetical protein